MNDKPFFPLSRAFSTMKLLKISVTGKVCVGSKISVLVILMVVMPVVMHPPVP